MKKILSLILILLSYASANALTFSKSDYSAVGTQPFEVKTADFDGDGNKDLAIVDPVSSTLGILKGIGNGQFSTTPISIPMAGVVGQIALTSANFNGDLKQDLAVVSRDPSTTVVPRSRVSLLLNTSTGVGNFSFTISTIAFPSDSLPRSIVSADFDGVNGPDLAVASYASVGKVFVLLNTGVSPYFATSAVSYTAVGNNPISIFTANLDGTANGGKPDLITTNTSNPGSISVLLNDGSGVFSAATNITTSKIYPVSVTAGYFDSGVNIDLAVCNSVSDNVSIMLGDGAGAFTLGADYTVVDAPTIITSGDYDSDGRTDLATSNSDSDNISVLLQPVVGFTKDNQEPVSTVDFAAGNFPKYILTDLLDSDTKPDLVAVNRDSVNASVFLNTTIPTSIEDVVLGKASVGPNPTAGQINIHLEKEISGATIEIRSLSGQKIFSQVHVSEKNLITFPSGVANGLYFVTLTNNKTKKVVTYKISLQR